MVKLLTTTCVLYHADSESVNHLFCHCQFAKPVWNLFLQPFGLPEPLYSMEDVWAPGGSSLDLLSVFWVASLLQLLCGLFSFLRMTTFLMLSLCLHSQLF